MSDTTRLMNFVGGNEGFDGNGGNPETVFEMAAQLSDLGGVARGRLSRKHVLKPPN